MIAFDLRCRGGHVFEAWFGSSGDYTDQQKRGLLHCPICGDDEVQKAVMAPAIGAKGNQRQPAETKAAMRELAAIQARLLQGSQWVGSSFADRARAMHMGEELHATIHGQASLAQAKALAEEGVPIAPLPLPVSEPSTQH